MKIEHRKPGNPGVFRMIFFSDPAISSPAQNNICEIGLSQWLFLVPRKRWDR